MLGGERVNQEEANSEVEYRLGKWIVRNLVQQGIINEVMANAAVRSLLEHYRPPTRYVEGTWSETSHED